MIASGRCHGPGCQQAANGDFCGEDDRVPALLSEGGCLQFWRGDHSGNHPLDEHPGDRPVAGGGATYALVAPVEPQVARHWFGRVLDRLRRTR